MPELSNISGNPHEPIVVLGTPGDEEGSVQIIRIAGGVEDVPAEWVQGFDVAAAEKQADANAEAEANAPQPAPITTPDPVGVPAQGDIADTPDAAPATDAPAGDAVDPQTAAAEPAS